MLRLPQSVSLERHSRYRHRRLIDETGRAESLRDFDVSAFR